MKKVIQLFLLGSALVLTSCNRGQGTIEEFSSEVGQFTIATPAPFEETQQSVETPVGPVEIYTYTAETDESAYVVAFSDYPSQMIEESEPEMLLNSSRDGAIDNLGGTLIQEEIIDIEGHPGRSLVISADTTTDEATIINSRIYLVDNRLYQILVVSPEEHETKAVTKSFLESFALN
jgi:hypothetical protein